MHLLVVVDYERTCQGAFDYFAAPTSGITDTFPDACSVAARAGFGDTPFVTLRVREVPSTSTVVLRGPRLTPSSAGYQQYSGVRISVVAAGHLAEGAPYFLIGFQFACVMFVLAIVRRGIDTLVWGVPLMCPKRRRGAQAALEGGVLDGLSISGKRRRTQLVYCRAWYQRVFCAADRAGRDDDDVVAWGELGYRFKPLELKELNGHDLGLQQASEAQRQRKSQRRSFATLHSDPVFGSEQGRGWLRPLFGHAMDRTVARFFVAQCQVDTEKNDRNSVRELARKLESAAKIPDPFHDHNAAKNLAGDIFGTSANLRDSLRSPSNHHGGENKRGSKMSRRGSRAAFSSRNPNPQSLGGASAGASGLALGGVGEQDFSQYFFRLTGGLAEREPQIRDRIRAAQLAVRTLYDTMVGREPIPPPGKLVEFRAKLNQCVKVDFDGLHAPLTSRPPPPTRHELLRRAVALDAALGVALRGLGAPCDNLVRLAMLEWWEAHSGHRAFAMNKHRKANAGAGGGGDSNALSQGDFDAVELEVLVEGATGLEDAGESKAGPGDDAV